MDLFLRQPNIESPALDSRVAAQLGYGAASGGGARAQDALADAGKRGSRVLDHLDEREPYSVAEDAYREERAYDARRQRRRKAWSVVRLILIAVAVPLAVIAAFLIAYCSTYIARGATPEELAAALGDLAIRAESFFTEAAAQW